MKKRYIWIVAIILLISISLVSCSSKYDESSNRYENMDESQETGLPEHFFAGETEAAINRKIIYSVNASLYTKDTQGTIKNIKKHMKEDEWISNELISSTHYASLTIRVKSTRLDTFIADIGKIATVRDFEKTATDISLAYQDKAGKIASLEAESLKLVELMTKPEVDVSDLIVINTRLSEIDLELQRLRGELNVFDSLHDYSTVNLQIYSDSEPDKPGFGNRIKSGFHGGWKAVKSFFQWLVVAAVTVFPFAIIFVPLTIGIIFLVIFIKKKKSKAKVEKDITKKD